MLYFILNPKRDAVKIGYSETPLKRMSDLQTASPDKLFLLGVCPGGASEEGTLHLRLDHIRLHGEWFRYTAELLSVAEEMCEGYSLYGRCSSCGEPHTDLHENTSDAHFVCIKCDPPGIRPSLRRSRMSMEPHRRMPAGGGYRVLRKGLLP